MIASLVPILLIGRSGKPGSSYLPGNSRQACSCCIRGTLIRYGGRHLLVWRNPLFPWVKTMGNGMDSNIMHINDLPQPYSGDTYSTPTGLNFIPLSLLNTLHFFNTNSILMSSLSNCTVCTNESIWSSLFPNNFYSSIRKMFNLNPSQDHNL